MYFRSRCFTIFLLAILILGLSPGKNALSQPFPPLQINIPDSSATTGYYFFAPYSSAPPYFYSHPQLILDKFGKVVWYRLLPGAIQPTTCYDFKIQPDNRMSFYSLSHSKFCVMDSTFIVSDSMGSANGFTIDVHDLQILPGGHYMLLAQESRIMNLSSYHFFGFLHNLPGGTNAEVIGVVIQEFDENKNLVWEWKAHDNFSFNDVDSMYLLSPNKVDWTHANAVEQDSDGNILLSCRHFNEITKINRQTGDIMWRLGGKRNQFNFINDPLKFTGQHDIRRISNGHVTLFDNGYYHNPPLARALEYDLDESYKIANLVWSYSYSSSVYSIAVGSHQVLPNGNHLIDFGNIPDGYPWLVLVKPDKTVAMEFSYSGAYTSYRAFNYNTLPWSLPRPAVNCIKSGGEYYLEAEPGHSEYLWSTGHTTQSIAITDTGEYWVFVPYGEGHVSSEHFIVTDPSNPCLPLSDERPHGNNLLQVECIPNPVHEKARLILDVPETSEISLTMLDQQGRVVLNVPAAVFSPGKNAITLQVNQIPGGMYFVKLISGQTVITKKIIVE